MTQTINHQPPGQSTINHGGSTPLTFGLMNRAANAAILALAVALLLTACNRRHPPDPPSGDSPIRQKVIGTWMMETGHLTGVTTFAADGTCSGGWTNLSRPLGWGYEGHWTVVGERLLQAVATNTSSWNYTPQIPTGGSNLVWVIRVDDQQLVLGSPEEDGWQTNTWTRVR